MWIIHRVLLGRPFADKHPLELRPGGHRLYLPLQLCFSLRPFSYSRKKKDQKETRLPAEHGSAQAGRSARSRFFRESPKGKKCNWVPYEPVRCNSTAVLDGKTRKNPPHHRSRRCCIRRGDPWVARLVARSDETIPVSNAIRFQSTTKAGRVVPSQSELRYPRRSVGQRIRWVR